MAPLHATAARPTRSDVHAKRAHDRSHRRDLLLDLRGDVRRDYGPAAARTRGRQGRLVVLVDLSRRWSVRAAAIHRAGPTPRWTSGPLPLGFRKRRRLPEARPPRRVELSLESIVASLQPIPLALHLATSTLGSLQLLAQPRVLLQQLVARQAVGRRALSGHAAVMPELVIKYKYIVAPERSSRHRTR